MISYLHTYGYVDFAFVVDVDSNLDGFSISNSSFIYSYIVYLLIYHIYACRKTL